MSQQQENTLNLDPVDGPWGSFSRMGILAGGQEINDSESQKRGHEQVQVCSATDSRANAYAEGFLATFGNNCDTKKLKDGYQRIYIYIFQHLDP